MLSRRTILKAMGFAAAAPATQPIIGAKTAAALTGLGLATNEPVTISDAPNSKPRFWGSSIQRRMDISSHADEAIRLGARYSHMKSWGYGFRHAVISRECAAESELRHRLERDESFFERISELALKGR